MDSHTTHYPAGQGDVERLLNEHSILVKQIAQHLKKRLPPSVQIDDLMQAGMICLLDAMSSYDKSQGASFRTYAAIRVRGGMLDEIRRSDWVPRSVRRKEREVAKLTWEIERKKGHDASANEIATAMGISLDEYYRIQQDNDSSHLCSIECCTSLTESNDNSLFPRSEDLSDGLQLENSREALNDAISRLPDRERLVITYYHDKGISMKDIGKTLDIGESRVSQIHAEALRHLRAMMSDWLQNED